MTNIVYKRLPRRYGAIPNEDESAAYGTYDIIVPAQFIDPETDDLLPWVREAWKPVLEKMKAERDKVVGDYLAKVEPDKTIREQLRKKGVTEWVDYIRSKSKDTYDDLLARFKTVDKTKTLIIPADVAAWSRWYFDTQAPADKDLTEWAKEKIKDSWPKGVMRYSPTVQMLGRQGIRYPAGATLGDFTTRGIIDLMSIPIDTPMGIVNLYNSLRTNARDTLKQLPAAMLNTLQEKYGGLDKIVTSMSESPVNTFIDILGALSLAKGVGKSVATGVAAANKRLRPLIPLAEEAASKGRAVTPPVIKEIGRQKYDALSKTELNNMHKLSTLQDKLAELRETLKKSKDVGPPDDIIKKIDILDRKVDTIGQQIADKRAAYNVELDTLSDMPYVHQTPRQDKLLYNPQTGKSPQRKIVVLSKKIDEMMQQSAKIAEEATARIGGNVDDLNDLMQFYARNKMRYVLLPKSDEWTVSKYASKYKTWGDTVDALSGLDKAIISGTALQPQYGGLLLSAPGTGPKAVRKGMTDRIDAIIEELLDVQQRKQRRTKSKAELDRLETRLKELENQLKTELDAYLQP